MVLPSCQKALTPPVAEPASWPPDRVGIIAIITGL